MDIRGIQRDGGHGAFTASSPGSYNGKLEDVVVTRPGGKLPEPIALEPINITQRRTDGLGELIEGTLAARISTG